MYIDRWQSTKGYEKLAEEYVSDESEPDDGKQKKKDWWSTDIKVEFDQQNLLSRVQEHGHHQAVLLSDVNFVLQVWFYLSVLHQI